MSTSASCPSHPWAATLLLASTLLLPSQGLLAQDPASEGDPAAFQGVVSNVSTGEPVASASVTIMGSDLTVQTDELGAFSFPDSPFGTLAIRVSAPGYVTVVEEVGVAEDVISFVHFQLPNLTAAVDELFVTGRAERLSGDIQSAADLLARQVFGVRSSSGVIGDTNFSILLRGVSTFTQSGEPAVYLDGARVSGGMRQAFDILSQVPASEVRDIRVLRGPAAAFLHSYGANGVIEVITRSGPDE